MKLFAGLPREAIKLSFWHFASPLTQQFFLPPLSPLTFRPYAFGKWAKRARIWFVRGSIFGGDRKNNNKNSNQKYVEKLNRKKKVEKKIIIIKALASLCNDQKPALATKCSRRRAKQIESGKRKKICKLPQRQLLWQQQRKRQQKANTKPAHKKVR